MAPADQTGSYGAPSPTIPFLLVSAMVGMGIWPWLTGYVSACVLTLQQMNAVGFLTPLLIVLGISLVSAYQKWTNPATPSSAYQPHNARDWRSSAASATTTGDYMLGSHHGDGTGVGLFILLVFALVLIPWR